MRSLPLLFVAVFIAIIAATSFSFAQTTTAKETNIKGDDIFRITNAIITRNGGAITTLVAPLLTPITKTGYHELELAWCDPADWFACLHSKNATTECRCSSPPTAVEESIRFKNGEENSQQQQRKICSVVSQHWVTSTPFEDEYKSTIEKWQQERQSISRQVHSLRTQEQVVLARLNRFNSEQVNATTFDQVQEYLKVIAVFTETHQKLQEQIGALDKKILELDAKTVRRNISILGRVLKVKLFCDFSASASNKDVKAVTQLEAQAVIPEAKWSPIHTLMIDTTTTTAAVDQSTSSTSSDSQQQQQSQVKMAARIEQKSYADWKDVQISLRRGAPGEDSTTNEEPPQDNKPLTPWILTLKSYAPTPIDANFMNQQNIGQPSKKQKMASNSKGGAVPKQQQFQEREESRRAARTQSASFSSESAMMMDEDEDFSSGGEGMVPGSEQQPDFEDPVIIAATTVVEPKLTQHQAVGSFTEETTLPHPVSIKRNSYSIVEIGTGKVSTSLDRVVAAYRCRSANNNFLQKTPQQQQGKQICAAPVFLRANVSNPNAFSILGGPTRIIVDGIPFNPSSSPFRSMMNNNNNAVFQPTLAPIAASSWGWVPIGEDTQVKVQRYEKSNVMSGTAADKGKNWFEKLMTEGKNSVEVEFEIRVINTRKVPVTIDVRDQFPRANTDEVEIKLTEATLKNKFLVQPSPLNNKPATAKSGSGDNNNGEEIKWKVEIGPNSIINIPFGFTVNWPKERFVHGLV